MIWNSLEQQYYLMYLQIYFIVLFILMFWYDRDNYRLKKQISDTPFYWRNKKRDEH